MQIFISSTCYDLIDLRSELETFFGQNGITAVLSDRVTSGFEVLPEKNSIENCLENLRKADSVVVILNQRYGPKLGAVGFGDISATHLEYREAVKAKKRIYFYVRDRLEADYNAWKKNGRKIDFSPSWLGESDFALFEFLEEHKKLEGSRDNWFYTFRDSVDLKAQLSDRMKEVLENSMLKRLFRTGSLPVLDVKIARIHPHGDKIASVSLEINNYGNIPALEVMLKREGGSAVKRIGSLGRDCADLYEFQIEVDSVQESSIELSCRIPGGGLLTTDGKLRFRREPNRREELSGEYLYVTSRLTES